MKDQAKTKDQLINELGEMRQRITELEDSLRESEERFRQTVDVLPTIVVEYDLEGLVTYVNDYGYELLGYSASDVDKGFRIPWLLPPDEVEKHMDRLARLLKGEKVPGAEYQLIHRDGSIVHALITSAPIYKNGEVIGIRSTATDISKHKKTEDALRESEHRFRMLVETMSDGLGVQDENGIITYVNQRVCELSGYSKDELVGRPATDLLEEPDRSIYAAEFAKRREGTTSTYEVTWTGKDGRKVSTLSSSAPIFDLEGNFRGSFAVITDITERKQAEDALRASEERYRAMVNTQIDLLCRFLADGTLTFVNEAVCKLLGKKQDEIIGQRFYVYLHRDDREKTRRNIESISADNPVVINEERVILPNGEMRWWQWKNQALFDDTGQIFEYQAVGRDITERVETEQKLQESEQRFRETVQLLPSIVVEYDSDFRVTYVNEAGYENLGYTPMDVEQGINIPELFPPDEQEKLMDRLTGLLEGVETPPVEYRLLHKNGSMVHCLVSSIPIYKDGKVVGIRSCATNITEHKRAQEKLQESEERHRLLLESSPDPIVVYDMEGRVTYVNPAFEGTFGWSSEELLGKRIDFVPEESWPETKAAIDSIKGGEKILSFETKRLTKDGEKLDIQLSSSLFDDRDGNPAGNIVILRDISERKRAEEALLESENYFRSLLYQLYEDILVIDADYQITDVNKSFLSTAGRAREDIIGHHCYEISHGYSEPCERKGEECPLHGVFESGEPRSCRHHHVRADGSKAWVDIFLSPLKDQKGNITHVIEGIRDVTDFIDMEEELRASEEKFRALFDHIPTMAFVVDRDHRLIATNWAFSQKMGDQAKRSTLELEGISPSTKQFWHSVEMQVIESAQPTWYMEVVHSPERGPTYMETKKQPIRDKDGKVAMVVGIATDITDYVREQIALTAQLKELRVQMSKEIGPRIVGKSKQISEVFGRVKAIAGTDTTVLITGESGTGKELVAEAIHHLSKRFKQPLIKVNCAALPESIIESELFGHVKGAFTGAVSNRIGRFEAANRGTIFLDEIGDISPAVQVRLLRVLEEKKVERVGDHKPISVDVRIIAATNQKLRNLVEKGRFRQDLYYRLNVFNINIPPLRERMEDIPLLVAHFLNESSRAMHKEISSVSDEVMKTLLRHNWGGNVRELMNVIESASVLCSGKTIQTEHLPPIFEPWAGTVDAAGDRDIREALRIARGNKAKAARLLGIHRSTLYRKMERYGIATE